MRPDAAQARARLPAAAATNPTTLRLSRARVAEVKSTCRHVPESRPAKNAQSTQASFIYSGADHAVLPFAAWAALFLPCNGTNGFAAEIKTPKFPHPSHALLEGNSVKGSRLLVPGSYNHLKPTGSERQTESLAGRYPHRGFPSWEVGITSLEERPRSLLSAMKRLSCDVQTFTGIFVILLPGCRRSCCGRCWCGRGGSPNVSRILIRLYLESGSVSVYNTPSRLHSLTLGLGKPSPAQARACRPKRAAASAATT